MRVPVSLHVALQVVLAALLAGAACADVSVRATIDRPEVAVGESADLSVEIAGTQDVAAPAIAGVEGLTIRYVGPSSQLSIVNGRTSASITHHFAVTAAAPGSFTIGPIAVEYGGRRYDAGSVSLRAVAAGAPSARADGERGRASAPLRLVLSSSRTRAYLHERVPVTLTLTVGAVQVSDVHYPTITGDGFALEPLREPVQRREQTAQGPVQVVDFATILTPLRAGELAVGPATLELTVPARRGGDPFFNRFFGGDPFAARRPVTLQSEPLHLEVLALPEAGKPADFSGAVGRFELQVEAAPRQLKAGDPVTVTTTIRGEGNLDGVRPPTIPENDALKVYPIQTIPEPAASATPAASHAVGAHAVFEQVVIPQRAGALTVAPLRFSYFDPEAATYRVLTGPPIMIAVQPSAQAAPDRPVGAVPVPAPAATAAPETLGRDIVFIKDSPGDLVPIGARRWRSRGFWAMQLLPATLWAVVVLYDRRRHRLRADPALARFTAAGRSARRAIAAAQEKLRAGDPVAFYEQLTRALREYLTAKLELPPGAVTADDIAARVRARGVDADVAETLRDLFATCERVRFAPTGAVDGDMRDALTRAEALVRRLERSRRIVRCAAPLAALLLAAGAVAAPAMLRAADAETPNTLFFRANALYGEEHYAEAASAYERVIAAGLESGPLYFNLGNAYFKAGDRGHAVVAYERARRLMPGDPDLRANLRFARDGVEDDEPPLASRVLFPLAPRVATDTLLLWASVFYAAVMLLLALARLAPAAARAARRAAATAAVTLAVVASSAGYRLATIDLPTWAVVVAPQGATVRFEPAPGGTAHFETKTGATLRVLSRREGWAQVQRGDGTRGWISNEAIARL